MKATYSSSSRSASAPLSIAVAVILSVGLASAQIGPGITKKNHANPGLTFGRNGNIPMMALAGSFAFNRLPGDPPGTWTVTLAGSGLAAAWGGKGAVDCLLGRYTRATQKFTPTKLAAALNTTVDDDTFMIDGRTGRYAILERNTGFYFAHRPSVRSPFSTPVLVRGLVVGFFKDFGEPSLGWVGGKLKIFFSKGPIYMADLDITNLAKPTVPPKSKWVAISTNTVEGAVPITGPDGDVEGFVVLEKPGGGDIDLGFMADFDPKTPTYTVFNTMSFVDGGAVAGSRFIASDRTKPAAAQQTIGAWLLGDTESIGGQVEIFGAMSRGANSSLTVVFFAAAPGAPIPLGGIDGAFALNLPTTSVLGNLVHADASDRGVLKFRLPRNPAFRGIRLALQGLSIDPGTPARAFTNTAWLTIR